MKIYILTFNFSRNNGAVLQMYALFRYLTLLGNDVQVVDYRPQWVKDRENRKPSSFKNLIIEMFSWRGRKKLKALLRNNLKFTKVCNNYKEIEMLEQPDCYFAGSDQIWNPDITGGDYDKGFFLEFKTSAKKVFYGASVGFDEIKQETVENIFQRVGDNSSISVRESGLYRALSENRNDIQHVLDPIFLIDKSDYSNMMKTIKQKKYILIYQMADDERCYQLARKIAEEFDYEIIDYGKIKKRKGVCQTVIGEAPDCFLGYLANAEYIVTNSFHGVALSIKFQKQFYAVKLMEKQSRISSLLELFALESRLVDDIESIVLSSINYYEKNDLILKEITKSQNFIKRELDCEAEL